VFELTRNDLKFYGADFKFKAEPGDFKLYIGTNSRDVREANFSLLSSVRRRLRAASACCSCLSDFRWYRIGSGKGTKRVKRLWKWKRWLENTIAFSLFVRLHDHLEHISVLYFIEYFAYFVYFSHLKLQKMPGDMTVRRSCGLIAWRMTSPAVSTKISLALKNSSFLSPRPDKLK
jgi:hypothetical protein